MQHKSDPHALVAFITIVIFLGVNFVAVKFSNQELPPNWGAALRFFIATIILLLLVKVKGVNLPNGKQLIGAVLYGLTGFGITYGLMYWALLSVNSGLSAVMFGTLPLITLLLAVFFGLEKLTSKRLSGALIVIVGLLIVFSEQLRLDTPLVPLMAILLAVTVAALANIIVKYFPGIHPLSMNVVGMGVGTIILLTASFIANERMILPTQLTTYLALGWLVTSSIVAFVSMVWLINKWDASRVSYTSVVTPLVTIIVAAVLLDESISFLFVIGSLLVLAGVYMGALSHR